MRHRAFTLIELLIVIGILAILAIVVFLILGAPTILQHTRDAVRLSDLQALESAVSYYVANAVTLSLGSSSIVYVSIPDPLATSTAGDHCEGLGLISLPASSGYSYHCAASSTYRVTNGTGWVPIPFTSFAGGSPIDKLPVDPVSQTSTYEYFTYATNGSQWQIYGHMESDKYQPQEAATNGYDPASYKLGTNVNIAPFAGGLAAYWPMNDGSGGTISDLSGDGYTGAITGATWTGSGCNGSANCLSFDGIDDYVRASSGILANPNLSVCAWIKMTTTGSAQLEMITGDGDTHALTNSGNLSFGWSNDNSVGFGSPNFALSFGLWTYLCGTRNGSALTSLYLNGNQVLSSSGGGLRVSGLPTGIGAEPVGASYDEYFYGNISGIRVWNRTLTPAEIQAAYTAGG